MLISRLFRKKQPISENISLNVIQFHLTYRCNLSCKFCWSYGGNKRLQEELSDKRVLEITKESCLLNPEKFIISGAGEPTLRKDLVLRMMSIIKNSGVKGELITNGTLIDNYFAKELIKLDWDDVQFSVQAPFKKIDAFLRGSSNAFDQSIKGIKAIIKEKRKSNKIKLSFKIVINKNNYKYLPSMLHLAEKLNIDGVMIRLLNIENQFCEEIMLNDKEKLELLRKIEKYKCYYEKRNIFLSTEFPISELLKNEKKILDNKSTIKKDNQPNRIHHFCKVPFHELLICPNGLVVPCCVFFGCQFEKKATKLEMVENVLKRSIKEIFYGKKFTKLREKFISDNIPQQCKSCSPDLQNLNNRYYE